ncbi:MAG: glycosyltransferase [Metallibacterium scheffleri]|jgi:GT2 family glycosyltransferase|uniref:glycosyltransferase family 2 protein n=1 Tax=Metallibacterium scheffleri TaxID=993689 RepID=UPI0026F056FE|nr:glycosyltransferase [Metallibacterium scheffleri]MCK9365956.1 glycosyltransferase [Metallibacterium scheffleri]
MAQRDPALNPDTQPRISVCIANYNGEGVLGDCLDSVLAQTTDERVEIIIHDDASTDASLQLLREHYPQALLIASEANVGFCIANNRMVTQARGEFVLLLNNDAALAPDALATLLHAAMQQRPQGILSLPQYDWTSGALVDRGCLLDPFYNPVPNTDPQRRDVAMVIGACLWLPRALWQELGGFPEWFESIGEDLYLCCHARLAGYPVQVTAASGYRHRQGASFGGNRAGASGLSTTYRRRRLSERNKTFAMMICTPGVALWLLLPLHLLMLTLEGIVLSLLRRDARLWHEVYAGVGRALWAQRKHLRAQRKDIQSARHATLRVYFSGFVLRLRKLDMLLRHGAPEIR